MSDIQPRSNARGEFFSGRNEAMLDRLLYSDFQRRIGGDLSEKQKERLGKTVKHYMNEVYSRNPGEPLQYLNKEVLQAVVPDYMSYLRRSQGPTVAEEEGDTALRMDVNARFGQLQNERQGAGAPPPVAPDFRVPLDVDGPTPLSRFEEIRKQREVEAQRAAEVAAAGNAPSGGTSTAIVPSAQQTRENPMSRFVDSDVDFRAGLDANKARDQLALVMREAERAMSGAAAGPLMPPAPQVFPDARKLLLAEAPPSLPRQLGIAAGNPTLALADVQREKPVLPQDVLKPQDDIVAYKESEHNLFIYSADRDWVNNNTENRYNFSVNFDPANNRSGFGLSPATQQKFKNITRIEFVKAIMPTEACDVFLRSTASSGTVPTLSTALNMNIFQYPYLQVRIPELNTNGFGTNDGMNNAFAAISYEAYWTADSAAGNRGYTRMIPKFLKCQKTFYPTPLATLQRLTFEIQRPDGQIVCESKDTLDISGVFTSRNTGGTLYTASDSTYLDLSGQFLFINTKTFFNRWTVTQGDRINLKNVDFSAGLKAAASGLAIQDLINFLTRDEGHLVCDVGRTAYVAGGTNKWTMLKDPSPLGYANVIIIRSNFGKRSDESPYLMPFGGTSAVDNTLQTQLLANPSVTSGRLINMNHQIQIILRVITREMDAATKLRPDNLQA